ncbi:hypothetical protein [Deinococcus sonorensis]|uniref:Uncharacterized protein n=2 Tax=Deinococcus sonorensis TaxID=309891 RepID=A0AAU7U819_9DEIO
MSEVYRNWLREQLSAVLDPAEAELLVRRSVQRHGWGGTHVFGPREVVTTLQDVYVQLRQRLGEAQADRWVEHTTSELYRFMAQVPPPDEAAPAAAPAVTVRWGRRAHDLPLLLARVNMEAAQHALETVHATPELMRVPGLLRAAEWDVQTARAELRRWEAEERLAALQAQHSRSELADELRSAQAQERLQDLTVRALEGELAFERAAQQRGSLPSGSSGLETQLAHQRLLLAQTRGFLAAFSSLTADMPTSPPQDQPFMAGSPLFRVQQARVGGTALAEQLTSLVPQARVAPSALTRIEDEVASLLHDTLETARRHQAQFTELRARSQLLEQRLSQLSSEQPDPLLLARVQVDVQQTGAAIRLHSDHLLEALSVLNSVAELTRQR